MELQQNKNGTWEIVGISDDEINTILALTVDDITIKGIFDHIKEHGYLEDVARDSRNGNVDAELWSLGDYEYVYSTGEADFLCSRKYDNSNGTELAFFPYTDSADFFPSHDFLVQNGTKIKTIYDKNTYDEIGEIYELFEKEYRINYWPSPDVEIEVVLNEEDHGA